MNIQIRAISKSQALSFFETRIEKQKYPQKIKYKIVTNKNPATNFYLIFLHILLLFDSRFLIIIFLYLFQTSSKPGVDKIFVVQVKRE